MTWLQPPNEVVAEVVFNTETFWLIVLASMLQQPSMPVTVPIPEVFGTWLFARDFPPLSPPSIRMQLSDGNKK